MVPKPCQKGTRAGRLFSSPASPDPVAGTKAPVSSRSCLSISDLAQFCPQRADTANLAFIRQALLRPCSNLSILGESRITVASETQKQVLEHQAFRKDESKRAGKGRTRGEPAQDTQPLSKRTSKHRKTSHHMDDAPKRKWSPVTNSSTQLQMLFPGVQVELRHTHAV